MLFCFHVQWNVFGFYLVVKVTFGVVSVLEESLIDSWKFTTQSVEIKSKFKFNFLCNSIRQLLQQVFKIWSVHRRTAFSSAKLLKGWFSDFLKFTKSIFCSPISLRMSLRIRFRKSRGNFSSVSSNRSISPPLTKSFTREPNRKISALGMDWWIRFFMEECIVCDNLIRDSG